MQENSSLVSIIIPFLNGGNWLAEAIESVLSQTYQNWELILIDDGSEKEHTEVAKRFSDSNPKKIIYLEHAAHANRGVTASRNLGCSIAKGNFLAFLDSDDRWLPQKLQHQLEIFKLHTEVSVICEASIFWYSWNNPTVADEIKFVGAPGGEIYRPPDLLLKLYPLGNGAPPCPTGIILTRNAFNRSGGFEEIFSGINQLYEDQALLSKLYLKENIFISADANNMYRKRAGSLTEAADDDTIYRQTRTFFLEWLGQYLINQKIKDERIFTMIENAKEKMIISKPG